MCCACRQEDKLLVWRLGGSGGRGDFLFELYSVLEKTNGCAILLLRVKNTSRLPYIPLKIKLFLFKHNLQELGKKKSACKLGIKDIYESVCGLCETPLLCICVRNESCSCLSDSSLLREQAGVTSSSLLSCAGLLSHNKSHFDSVGNVAAALWSHHCFLFSHKCQNIPKQHPPPQKKTKTKPKKTGSQLKYRIGGYGQMEIFLILLLLLFYF